MFSKSIGDASSPEEQIVESTIKRVPAWDIQDITYERIQLGITNSNWRIRNRRTDEIFFLKVPGNGTELFINRRFAHDANVKAADGRVGPRVLYYFEDSGVEIFEYLLGYRSCNVTDFQALDMRLKAVAVFKRLHDGAPFLLTKNYFDMIEEHLGQVRELIGPLGREWDFLMWQYTRIQDALRAAGLDIVPCINDTYVTDFMINDATQDMKFVDFEYASNNDRCADLAVWAFELYLDDAAENEVIEGYFGQFHTSIKSRIALYKVLISIKWTLWTMVQAKMSSLPFDYSKYGSWLTLRGRYHLRDWQWETYLRSL